MNINKQIISHKERRLLLKKIFFLTLLIFCLIPISALAVEKDAIYQMAPSPYEAITDGDDNTFYQSSGGQSVSYQVVIPLIEPISRNAILSAETVFSYIGAPIKMEFLDKNNVVISKADAYRSVKNDLSSQSQSVVYSLRLLINDNGKDSLNDFILTYDTDLNTYVKPVSLPVINLSEKHNHNSATLTWLNPQDSDFDGVIVLKDGVQIANLSNNSSSYGVAGLSESTAYNFEVIAKYKNQRGNSVPKSITITTDPKPADTTPTGEISSLTVTKTSDIVNLIYQLPIDSDFSHLEIYRDNVLLENNYTQTSYSNFNLVPNTMYVFKIVSVDTSGNKSNGVIQSVTTNPTVNLTPPNAPTGLNTTVANAAGRAFWTKNKEIDIAGYNLYIDGVKYNSSLILANNFVVNGLNNAQTYSIAVTAVNTSGIESAMSVATSLTPSQSAMPIFKSNYDLKDVADGTSSWFVALWPLLAFSVGIVLAFIVANRVKHLVLN